MGKSRISLLSSGGIRRCFLLLVAVCWFCRPASATDAQHSAIAMHLLRPGVAAFGDLDGDHIPDLASGIRTVLTPKGYSYRVDLDFSADSEAKHFDVLSQDSTGLNIEAVDIDGDHDLDLLVRGRFSPQPIGIWFNDGRGRFTQGDLTKYVLVAWQTRPAIQSPNTNAQVILHFARRPQFASGRQRLDFRAAHSIFDEAHFLSRDLFQISTSPARLRAPPIISI
jgi:hypothetical protein